MSESLYKDLEPAIVEARMVAMQAGRDHGDFASMHEGYGVLIEEVQDLLDAIRLRQSNPERASKIHLEAIDVASVALRMASQAHRVKR